MNSSSSGSDRPPSLQALRASRGQNRSFLRRFRRSIICAGVVVILILFGFFGLPPIVKAQAIKQLSARLGREVGIEKVRINPLTLSTTIEGFSIAEADPAAGEFTGWRRLFVNFDSWSLLTGGFGFQEISLDGFRARVAKGRDGKLNFDDIVAKLLAPDPEAPPPAPKDPNAKPIKLSIGTLAVTDAQVSFTDASLEQPFDAVVGPLAFTLERFRTVGDPDSPYRFEALTGAGERLSWRGTVSADPVKSSGELVVTGIDIARLSPYFQPFITGQLRSAFVDVSGSYNFELQGATPALTLSDGAVTLRDVRFGAREADDDAFALKGVAVTGIAADSVAMKADIAKVAVEGVRVKVTRDADGIDLLRLVMPQATSAGTVAAPQGGAASPSSSAATAPSATPALPVVTLGELSVADVQVEAIDLTTPRRAEHRIEDVRFVLRDVSTADLAKFSPLSLEVKLPQEGRIAVEGQVAPLPTAATLDIALDRVPFANASPYVEPFLNIRLAGGSMRARGRATLQDGAATFSGDFGIDEFRTVDGKLAQDFVKWTGFSITGIKATTTPLAFHADEIRFVEPSATVRIEADGSLSIAQALAQSPGGEKTSDAPAPAAQSGASAGELPIAVSIGTFAFDRAAFRFEDHSIKPAARSSLSDFNGKIVGLDSAKRGRADVDIGGKVDGVAPVSISGKLDPLGTPAFVDLKVDFKGIDLQPGAGPYVGKYAGRELTRGNLNVAVTAKLNDRKLDTNNVVTLDRFYLGAPTNSPDATKLPVNLALALLRDSDGKIVIDLPVKGSLDDPEFKIGKVVVRVLTNILTKAATSPFSLLGAAFGGGGDELGWQDFEAGLATLDADDVRKLETVAKALNGRPALNLDIVGSYDPVADLASLRRAQLDRQIRAVAWEMRRSVDPNTPPPEELEVTPELRAGVLAKLYTEAFPVAPGEKAPVFVAGESTVAVPKSVLTPQFLQGESQERPRTQVGRLPRYNTSSNKSGSPVAVDEGERDGQAAGEETAPVQATDASGAPIITLGDMEARLVARIEVPEAELQALGEARAHAVRAWLLETGKVAGDRVFLGPVEPKGTRVNLSLK